MSAGYPIFPRELTKSLLLSMTSEVLYTQLSSRTYPRVSIRNSHLTITRSNNSSCSFSEIEKFTLRTSKRFRNSSRIKRRRTPRRNALKPELTCLLPRVSKLRKILRRSQLHKFLHLNLKMLLKIKLISSLLLNLMILKGKLGRKSTTGKLLTIQPVLWNTLLRESILMMSLKIKHLILEIEHQFFIIKNPCLNL